MTGDVQADNQGDVTATIVGFARSVPVVDIPEEVIESAKVHILDTLGVAFAGSVSDVARIVREDISAQGLSGQGSAIIGTSLSAPPPRGRPRQNTGPSAGRTQPQQVWRLVFALACDRWLAGERE